MDWKLQMKDNSTKFINKNKKSKQLKDKKKRCRKNSNLWIQSSMKKIRYLILLMLPKRISIESISIKLKSLQKWKKFLMLWEQPKPILNKNTSSRANNWKSLMKNLHNWKLKRIFKKKNLKDRIISCRKFNYSQKLRKKGRVSRKNGLRNTKRRKKLMEKQTPNFSK